MMKYRISLYIGLFFLPFIWQSCKVPFLVEKQENRNLANSYLNANDSISVASISWKSYFSDENLLALIDTALQNNQELNVVKQEIEISRNEIRVKKGEYLPFVGLGAGTGYEKIGKYTWRGGVEKNINNINNPEILESKSDFSFGLTASWELDIWKKLRNAKEAAVQKYLGSVDGKNFLITNLISEIADSYYELLALDNMLEIVEKNIIIQSDALKVVKLQKESARVTLLAVNRFEAQLLRTQNLQFDIRQKITETENKIRFLTGKSDVVIKRSSTEFYNVSVDSIQAGIPSQLLINRPDVLRAEKDLVASRLDMKSARANFYPSFSITAQSGMQAFNPKFLFNPQAIIYNLVGDMVAPLINRNAIKATYYNAGARQVQTVYRYEQVVLNAYLEVLNEMVRLDNYTKSFGLKSKEVAIRNESVMIASSLFNSARADYGEVLFTQGEVLDAKMELIEIKMQQLHAKVNLYRSLGGGWK